MNSDVIHAMDELSAALECSRNEPLPIAIARLRHAVEQNQSAAASDAILHLLLIQHRRIDAS